MAKFIIPMSAGIAALAGIMTAAVCLFYSQV